MVRKAISGTTRFRGTCPPKSCIGSCWECVLAGSLSQRRRERKEMLSAFCNCHGQVTLAGVSHCVQNFPHSRNTANIMREACSVATLSGSKDGLYFGQAHQCSTLDNERSQAGGPFLAIAAL
ncbi:unnamed protein product [Symbiodinium sp. CCMP2456]|nr:unnamed protein product [Symbiodinium sp. CCMP2456]